MAKGGQKVDESFGSFSLIWIKKVGGGRGLAYLGLYSKGEAEFPFSVVFDDSQGSLIARLPREPGMEETLA